MTTDLKKQRKVEFDRVITVGPERVDSYRALRHRGLREHPEYFGESPENFERKLNDQILERITAQRDQGGCILAAASTTGELIGMVGLAVDGAGKSRHRGLLWGMYVIPECRGQGAVQALIDELLRRAELISELEQIHLAVATTNEAAVRLYERNGFSTYGIDPRVLKVNDQAFDEYLMVKRLPRATLG